MHSRVFTHSLSLDFLSPPSEPLPNAGSSLGLCLPVTSLSISAFARPIPLESFHLPLANCKFLEGRGLYPIHILRAKPPMGV